MAAPSPKSSSTPFVTPAPFNTTKRGSHSTPFVHLKSTKADHPPATPAKPQLRSSNSPATKGGSLRRWGVPLAFGVSVVAMSIGGLNTFSRVTPAVFDLPPREDVAKDDIPLKLGSYGDILGAESFTEDIQNHNIYTGLGDGRLLRLKFAINRLAERSNSKQGIPFDVHEVARFNTSKIPRQQCGNPLHEADCGRVLGLRYVPPNEQNSRPRIIACERKGLVEISLPSSRNTQPRQSNTEASTSDIEDESTADSESRATSNSDRAEKDSHEKPSIRLLTDSDENGRPIRFCNSLDLAPDGSAVYFTDSSKRTRAEFTDDILEGHTHGRLLRYDFSTQKTEVVIPALAFANGVTLTHEGDALLVAELMRAKIWKYYLRGPQKGVQALWVSLPFLPDNIQRHPDGVSYLIGSSVPRSRLGDYALSQMPILRKAMGLLSRGWVVRILKLSRKDRKALVTRFDGKGKAIGAFDATLSGGDNTSEGFIPSFAPEVMLWGSFDHTTPLFTTKAF